MAVSDMLLLGVQNETQATLTSKTQVTPQIADFEIPKQKSWLIIGLAILVFFLLGTTGYLAYQNYQLKQEVAQKQPTPTPLPELTKQPEIPSPTLTEGSTINWKTYQDSQQRFSFKYPVNTPINIKNSMLSHVEEKANMELLLIVESFDSILANQTNEKIAAFYNLGYDYETAKRDYESLQKCEYGEFVDFAWQDSKRVVRLDNMFAKTFTVLGRFDAGDIAFERRAIFYPDNQSRAILILYGPEDKIISENLQYFNGSSWDYNDNEDYGANKFYQNLQSNQASESTEKWYTTFDQILSTFKSFQ